MTYAPRHILVPTDFSDHAAHALDVAASLARTIGADLRVLHVYMPPQHPLTVGLPLLPLDMIAGLEQQVGEALDQLCKPLIDAGLRVEQLTSVGVADVEIVRAAQRGVDLVVMGTHGRTGLGHALMGSVAEKVVRRAPCPVLVVPARYGAERRGQAEPAAPGE